MTPTPVRRAAALLALPLLLLVAGCGDDASAAADAAADSRVDTYSGPGPCTFPSHSDDCSEVGLFGGPPSIKCEGPEVVVDWHEHIFCGDGQQVKYYGCTYLCPASCAPPRQVPTTGSELVASACQPAPADASVGDAADAAVSDGAGGG